MKVIISHSSTDKPAVQRLAQALKNRGIDVWYDAWELKPGDSLVSKIESGLADSSVLLATLSQSTTRSRWVRAEISAFLNRSMSDRGIRIIPVLLERVQIPPLLRDRLYVDLSRDFEEGTRRLADALLQAEDPCATLPEDVVIESFNAGTIRPNELGGITLVYHENGGPLSLRKIFVNRGRGKALGLLFDFSQRQPGVFPPQFVGYATRLQLADWTSFLRCGYWLCFDARTDGNAMGLHLEVKRLAEPPREESRQEIAKWQVDLLPDWDTKCLRLSDIAFPNSNWDNMWEVCFVLFRDAVIGDHGLIQIDNLRLTRAPGY